MSKDGTYNGPEVSVFRSSEGGGNIPEFFRNYYPMFVSFARNFVQSREVCEDLVQEAFVALLEQGCTFDNEYLAKGFLYKTLRNKCLNHLRHEQIRSRYAEMQAAHYKRERSEKKSEEFFIDAIMREESSLIISQAIEGLPEMGRQVLNMSVRRALQPGDRRCARHLDQHRAHTQIPRLQSPANRAFQPVDALLSR